MLSGFFLYASSGDAPCNEYSNWINSSYNNKLTATSSKVFGIETFSNKNRLINDSLTDYASWTGTALADVWIEVKDTDASGSNVYPAGSYAGFFINDLNIVGLGATVSVITYLGNTQQESYSDGSIISTFLDNGRRRIGFVTSKDFDRVRLRVQTGVSAIFTLRE